LIEEKKKKKKAEAEVERGEEQNWVTIKQPNMACEGGFL